MLILLIDIYITNRGDANVVTKLGNPDQIIFTCVAEGYPAVHKMWWDVPFNGTVLNETRITNTAAISTIQLNGTIEYKHSGQYVCSASNSVIERSLAFQVVVKGELLCICIQYIHTSVRRIRNLRLSRDHR